MGHGWWNDERDAELTKLWKAGFATRAIGDRMGISKSAVIGRAYRINLPARPSGIKPKAPPAPKPAVVTVAPQGRAYPPSKEPLACRWIEKSIRDPDWHYCNGRLVPGRMWCAEHLKRIYTTDRPAAQTARLMKGVA